jgi:signal transduction histidine kinase
MNWIERLFSTSGFMPHGFCYTWDPHVIWLNGASDALIALAYYTIPVALVYFVRRRKDLAFHWMFLCFALFIVACGTTHAIELWSIWHPVYWLAGVIKAVTAAASIATAAALIQLVPKALALPSPDDLKRANRALQEAQEALLKANEELERRVVERTASLGVANAALQTEIEERKRTDAYLSEAQRLSRTGSFGWNVTSGKINWSQETFRIFEYDSATEPTLELVLNRIHPEDRALVQQVIDRVSRQRTNFDLEHRLLMPDHSVKYLRVVGRASKNVSSSFEFVGAVTDMTERKQAELEAVRQRTDLAHAARLTMVGELTASITHELGQPLGAILSNVETAEILLESAQPHLEGLQEILADIGSDALRASDVIRRMHGLLRKRELELKAIDLNKVTSDVLRLVGFEAHRRRVDIEEQFADTLPAVRGDVMHVEQVLLNLILNGLEALAESSESNRRLTVCTAYNGKGYVEVAVRDSGPGIPPDRLPRLFDSFFTTKTHGMGLGLSIVRSIVEAHEGRIWAENNPAGGACFRFTLPVNGNDSGRTKPASQHLTREQVCNALGSGASNESVTLGRRQDSGRN